MLFKTKKGAKKLPLPYFPETPTGISFGHRNTRHAKVNSPQKLPLHINCVEVEKMHERAGLVQILFRTGFEIIILQAFFIINTFLCIFNNVFRFLLLKLHLCRPVRICYEFSFFAFARRSLILFCWLISLALAS